MSLNKLTDVERGKKAGLKIGCSHIEADIISVSSLSTTNIKSFGNLIATTDDSKEINFSTPDQGTAGYVLHTDGTGNTYWDPPTQGCGNLVYNGTEAVQIGTFVKASSTDFTTLSNSKVIESATELNLNGLNMTNTGTINGVNLSTLSSQTSTNTSEITQLQNNKLSLNGTSTMSGDLNMGSNNITNTGTINGLNLAMMSSQIGTNTSNISTNTSQIGTNTSNISTNTSDISTNTSNISTNTSNIAGKLNISGTNIMTGDLNLGGNQITSILNTFQDGYSNMGQIVTPSTNPSTNTNMLYFKSDNNLYSKDSTGVEKQIGVPVGSFIEYSNQSETTIGQHVYFDNTTGSVVNQSAIIEDLNSINLATKVVQIGNEILASQISTPSNPPATKNSLYFKSDNNLYSKDSSGVETKISNPTQIIPYDLGFACSSETKTITATGEVVRIPITRDFSVNTIFLGLNTPNSTGSFTVSIKYDNGTTIQTLLNAYDMGTIAKHTISRSPVDNLTAYNYIIIEIDNVGSSSAIGLKCILNGYL